MDFKIEKLDPDWTVFIRCLQCPARTFACCAGCARDGMIEHLAEAHAITPAPAIVRTTITAIPTHA